MIRMFHWFFLLCLPLQAWSFRIQSAHVSQCQPNNFEEKKLCERRHSVGTLLKDPSCCGSVVAGYRVSSNFIKFQTSQAVRFLKRILRQHRLVRGSVWFCVREASRRNANRVQNSEFFKLRSRLGRVTRSKVPGLPGDKDLKRIVSISDSNLLDVLWSHHNTTLWTFPVYSSAPS
jgi:hypothetical protein